MVNQKMPLFAVGELNTLPPDVLDQIAAMQKAIDKLTADFASVITHATSCTTYMYVHPLSLLSCPLRWDQVVRSEVG